MKIYITVVLSEKDPCLFDPSYIKKQTNKISQLITEQINSQITPTIFFFSHSIDLLRNIDESKRLIELCILHQIPMLACMKSINKRNIAQEIYSNISPVGLGVFVEGVISANKNIVININSHYFHSQLKKKINHNKNFVIFQKSDYYSKYFIEEITDMITMAIIFDQNVDVIFSNPNFSLSLIFHDEIKYHPKLRFIYEENKSNQIFDNIGLDFSKKDLKNFLPLTKKEIYKIRKNADFEIKV